MEVFKVEVNNGKTVAVVAETFADVEKVFYDYCCDNEEIESIAVDKNYSTVLIQDY